MLKYINEFFDEFGLSSTERVTLAIAYEKMREHGEAYDRLTRLVSEYEKDMKFLATVQFSEIEAIANLAGVHKETTLLLILICMTKKLKERLVGLGLSKKNVYLTVSDLIYKMHENERTLNIVGTGKWAWYSRFFTPSIFAIGRLQFELATYTDEPYEKDGKAIRKGDPVLKVHIPMSGEPLEEKACSASYRDAKKFFTNLLGIDDIAITCSSWLLSPFHKEVLGEKSNIVKFASRYDITRVVEFDVNNAIYPWLFDVSPDTPLEKLPKNTTLRRAYVELFEKGGKVLSGSGIFFLEPPKQKAKKAVSDSNAPDSNEEAAE